MTDTLMKKIVEETKEKKYIFTMPEPVHFIMTDLYSKMKTLGYTPRYIHIYHDLPVELQKNIKVEVKTRIIN